jgi:transposase
MSKRVLHSKQFRDEACKLVTEHGYNVAEAARQLGISRQNLWNWLTQHGQNSLANQKLAQEVGDDPQRLKARVRELEERVQRLELEKEILKKATAYFAREQA